MRLNRTIKQTGDTLVEVMISIAVIALAIAISYAISGKNLNVGINARERTQAVGLVQGQIERMNELQQINPNVFGGLKNASRHFCISAGNVVTTNSSVDFNNDNLTAGSSYGGACIISSKFYMDITYQPLVGSGATASGNSFKFTARWYRAGGGPDQTVTTYYRPW